MTKIQNPEIPSTERFWSNRNSNSLLLEMQNCMATLKANLVGFFLIKPNKLLTYDLAVVFLGIYLFELKTYVHRNLHTDVYSNFIHNYQNLEATTMDFSG